MQLNLVKIISILAIALLSCSTPQKAPRKEPKKSAKSQKDAKAAAQAQIALQMNTNRTSTDDLVVWVVRMSSPGSVFTMKDRQFVTAMQPNPKAGSMAEAALVVGILRDIMTPPGGATAFKDIDVVASPEASATTDSSGVLPKPTRKVNDANSLERRAREKGVDLAGALANNSLLKNAAVFTWVWNAMLLEGNSEAFKQTMGNTIRAEAALWQDIANKSGVPQIAGVPTTAVPPVVNEESSPQQNSMGAAVQPGEANLNPAGAAVTPPGLATGGSGAVPDTGAPALTPTLTPENNAEANAAMGRAQEAAVGENYLKAVEEASKIPESSPLHGMAQENIRSWSNRAVTDLRKKAAFEYRSSTSVADATAKKGFLKKAKNYLEEALKNFPNASNLDTVQENLRMINSELGL